MGFDVVCLVASLGGVTAVGELLGLLPAGFPAAVVVVLHRSDPGAATLPRVWGARSALPVRDITDGDQLIGGVVHLTPAAREVTLDAHRAFRVAAVSPASRLRPADSLLVSVAAAFGSRVIAVVMTGRLDDGAWGVRYVKGAGGRVLVQEPAGCAAAGMPSAALGTGCVDFALSVPALADALAALTMAPGAAGLMRVGMPGWATPVRPAPLSPAPNRKAG